METLRWLAPILDCSGYASAARGYLRACDEAGILVQARDRSRSINLKGKGVDANVLSLYERLSKTVVPADCPTVQHQVPDAFFTDKKAKRSIGYTIFEMTRIPQTWVTSCNRMDEIWTGSEYSRSAFVESGVKVPVSILPHAIDTDAYSPMGTRWTIENRRSFAFLSVFDFTSRKAWKDLLLAYWSAFSKSDDVCLILKCYFGDFSDDARKDIARRILRYRDEMGMNDRAPILLYGHDIPDADMPSLYRSADCYVGISREGFGLAFAEAMACGLPTIGPSVGGNRQYMHKENSLLINYLGDEPVDRELSSMFPAFEGLMWARHDWKHLAELMQDIVHDNEKRKRLASAGRAHISAQLTYEVIGNKIKKLLTGQKD